MLAFLKKRDESGVSASPESIKREPDHEEDYDAVESAFHDLMEAIEKKDAKAGAAALRAAIELCSHQEGPLKADGEM